MIVVRPKPPDKRSWVSSTNIAKISRHSPSHRLSRFTLSFSIPHRSRLFVSPSLVSTAFTRRRLSAAGLKRIPFDSLIDDTTMRYYLLVSRARLATAVFVALVCHGILSNAQSADGESDKNIVNVDVYYESLCSDSMRWIVNQLVPSYPELKRHIHVTFVPYGKATHTRESETGPWQFVCQHGPAECRGNKVQACAIHSIQSSETAESHQLLMVKLVGCAMSAGNPPTAVPQCAQDVGLSEETRKLIDGCIAGPLADDLLAANGDKTEALQPSLKFVPTIVINGVYSKENQDEAIRDFPTLVCRHLTAQEKPSVCGSED